MYIVCTLNKNDMNNMRNIKYFDSFINENKDSIISQLDSLGVKYELSDGGTSLFKVIYKPINKSDKFYKKFDEVIYLNNLEKVVVQEKI